MVYAPYTNGGEKEPEKIVVLWAGHLEPPAMGKHAREIVFSDPMWIQKVMLVKRGEKPYEKHAFEGKTAPNITIVRKKMNIYCKNLYPDLEIAEVVKLERDGPAGSVWLPDPKLHPDSEVKGAVLTNHVVVMGDFKTASLVIIGKRSSDGQPISADFKAGAKLKDVTKLDLDHEDRDETVRGADTVEEK